MAAVIMTTAEKEYRSEVNFILLRFQVCLEPVKSVVVEKLRVLMFQYPVAFIRKYDQFGRNVSQLQRRVKLVALIDRNTIIELACGD
jgi:hypothetical protein